MSSNKTKPDTSYSVPKDWESASTWSDWQNNASKDTKAGSDLSCVKLAQICSAPVISTSKFTTMDNSPSNDAEDTVSVTLESPTGYSTYPYTIRVNDFDIPPPANKDVTSSLETCLKHYSSDGEGTCRLDSGKTAQLNADDLQSIIIPGNTDKDDWKICTADKCNSIMSYIPRFESATDAFQGVVKKDISNEDQINKRVSQYIDQRFEDEMHQDSKGNYYAPA